MKRVLLSILTGTVLLISPLIPGMAQAQTDPWLNQFPVLEELELTPDQEAQLADLRQATRPQLEQILTADQRQQFRTAMEQGQGFRAALTAMNLTQTQQTQLREVLQSTREDFRAILTPEQREELANAIQTGMESWRRDRQP